MSNVVFELFAKLGLDSSEYEKGLGEAKSKAGAIGGAIAGGFKTAAKVGAVAISAATTAATAFATSSVKAGQDFDKSMSQVAATMGKTMDEMANETGKVDLAWGTFSGNLREYAQEMGKNTAFSASEAADALNYMALAGYDAQTSMEMLPNVLNLAAAGNMDLARASDMVTDTQSALGLTLEETATMVDQMAKASSKTNTSVEQLGDAMLTIGATARGVKGGTVELSTVLGILADNGIKGAEGGTHLRNAILSLQTPTKDGVAALEQLGMTYDDMYDKEGNLRSLPEIFQQMSTAMEGMNQQSKDAIISGVFNKTDLAAVNALIGTNKERWDEVTAAIGDSKGAAQAMADTQLDNLAGDLTLFQSALEGAKIAISDKLTPTLRDFVKFGTEGLSNITDAFQKGGLTGAMEAFGEVLAEGLNIIIDKIPMFIDAGMKLLGALGQGIIDNMPKIVESFVQVVVMLAQGLVAALPELVKGFITLIGALKDSLSENAEPLLEAGKTLLEFISEGIFNNLPEMIKNLYEKIPEILSSITEFIKTQAPLMMDAGAELLLNIVEGIMDSLPNVITAAVDMVVALANALTNPDTLVKLVVVAGDLILALANGLLEAIPKLLDAIPQIISNLVGAIVGAVPEILMVGTQLLLALITGIIQTIPRLIAAIPAIILALVGGLAQGIKSITKVGKDMVEGLWKGIKGRWDGLVRDFKNLASGFIDGIKGLFGIHSPSTVFAEIGRNLDAGLANGLTRYSGLVDDAMNGIADMINSTDMEPSINVAGNVGYSNAGSVLDAMANEQNENKNLTVILELERNQLAKAVYTLNNEETQRVGLNLAGGYA